MEFAIILPVFLLLLLGLMEYGWYFYIDIATRNAAREGARAASLYSGSCPNATGNSAATSAVSTYIGNLNLTGSSTTTTVTCTSYTKPDGNTAADWTVQVTLTFPRLTGYTIVPVPNAVGTTSMQAIATAMMRGP